MTFVRAGFFVAFVANVVFVAFVGSGELVAEVALWRLRKMVKLDIAELPRAANTQESPIDPINVRKQGRSTGLVRGCVCR